MTTEQTREDTAAELSQDVDEIEASIAALEKVMMGSGPRNREAIHELGCKIVAQALKSE